MGLKDLFWKTSNQSLLGKLDILFTMKGGLLGLVLLGTILAIEAKVLLGDFKKKDANRVMAVLESFPKQNRVQNDKKKDESKEIDDSSRQDETEEDQKENEEKPDKKIIKQKRKVESSE